MEIFHCTLYVVAVKPRVLRNRATGSSIIFAFTVRIASPYFLQDFAPLVFIESSCIAYNDSRHNEFDKTQKTSITKEKKCYKKFVMFKYGILADFPVVDRVKCKD